MAQTPLLRRDILLHSERPQTVRGTYYVQTWGCQMNEEDSEQIGLYLQGIGFRPTESLHEAHVVLLNTCSVRKKPEDKAFSLLGELGLLKKVRPELIVGVAGCMAQLREREIRRRAPHVDFVVGTAQIAEIPVLVEEAVQSRGYESRMDLPERKGSIVTEIPQRKVDRGSKLKAFVPIQYGCDKFCTFCIVPTTRGRERSRPTEHILEEVSALVAHGTREVTLLGQTVNSYGKNLEEGKVPFSSLLNLISKIDGLERIRYTSPYPRDFKSDLIDEIRDNPKVMPHLHMPLQAGDNDVLKSMKRLYTRESFLEIIEEVKAKVPDVGITTDIIVGFPEETEEQFEQTLDMMRRIRFDGAYMFIYSPRPGTPAAEMTQLPLPVRKDRMYRLMEVQNPITLENNEAWVGREMEVLVEGPCPKKPGLLQGLSQEFRMCHFEGPAELTGRLAMVRATSAHPWGMTCELVD